MAKAAIGDRPWNGEIKLLRGRGFARRPVCWFEVLSN